MTAFFSSAAGHQGVRLFVLACLGDDQTILATMARTRFLLSGEIHVVAGRSESLSVDADPSRSLVQVGADWMVDPEMVRLILARRIEALMGEREARRVSSTQPALKATDPVVVTEPLFVVRGATVLATTDSIDLTSIQRVVALSEGYPPGLVAVHEGSPETPKDAVWFALSAFDGETYVVWD